ncbi:hypothetical protein EQM05_08685 [Clostridium sp. JN-9]|nr:hypothetical protein EQM05_08685 [Clostridium sp. JN-9]
MIIREENIKLDNFSDDFALDVDNNKLYKNTLFFDLEHYVYKVPICIGVFGCCYYIEEGNSLKVTQYMIENENDANDILALAKDYFINMYEQNNKRYIVTFSGNNDFSVINYLFNKHEINYTILDHYSEIDLQKYYENTMKKSIGLKNLEKEFNINRSSELISGQNLAKTFSKMVKDSTYIKRMPGSKVEKILQYNKQDVVSLFYMVINWEKYVQLSDS